MKKSETCICKKISNKNKMIDFDNLKFCSKTCIQKYSYEKIKYNIIKKEYIEVFIDFNTKKLKQNKVGLDNNIKSLLFNFVWNYEGNENKKCLICNKDILNEYLKRNVLYNPYKDVKYCGMSCAIKSKETQSKIKNTLKERYGRENYVNSEKAKQTKLERYGNPNYNNLEKYKQTILDKYGVSNVFQSNEIKQKIKDTNLKKYGVENPQQNKHIREKTYNTNLEKYGYFSPLKSDKVKEKIKETNLERYGVEYPQQNKDIRLKATNNQKETIKKNFINKYKLYYSNIYFSIPNYYNNKKDMIDASQICIDYNIDYHFIPKIWKFFNIKIPYYFSQKSQSQSEKEIVDFIKENHKDIIENDRKILNGKELDIYIPEYNFAIEYDGLYWHSFNNSKNIYKTYHLEKTIECEKNNIHLFHIFEDEWLHEKKKDIWKSKILIKLHSNKIKKLNARDGYFKEIDTKTSKIFLEENHLQGYTNAKYKIGFYIKDKLVSVFTLGKSRFKKDEFELIRFSTLKYHIVRGLMSKFIKYYKDNFNYNLISYGNRRWVYKNNVYSTSMRLESISSPNYFYFNNELVLHNRIKFQKHKLEKLHKDNILNNYDKNKTELENMLLNNYRIIYDCGNYKYKLNNIDR